MFRKSFAVILFLLMLGSSGLAQSDIKIKKKISMKIPGATVPDNTPQKYKDLFREMMNPTAVVYLKGSQMRTDTTNKKPDRFGNPKSTVSTIILQCDKQRSIRFNDKKKKYYVEDAAADAKSKKGGFVTISLTVTDTGERMKLFGYNARRIKQKITVTPGANSCQKETFEMQIDGWYADIPNFSCPFKTDISEVQMQKGCFDEVVFDIKGETVTGFPVKEIKSIAADGQTISIEEEVVEIVNTTLDAALFEPPADYKPANTKAEALKDDDAQSIKNSYPQQTNAPAQNQTIADTPNLFWKIKGEIYELL